RAFDEEARREQQERRWRDERAAQVVEHLPARDRRQVAAAPAEDPWQQLPVAARPTVAARSCNSGVRRILLEQLDVAHERAARVAALQQVVAQDRVGW